MLTFFAIKSDPKLFIWSIYAPTYPATFTARHLPIIYLLSLCLYWPIGRKFCVTDLLSISSQDLQSTSFSSRWRYDYDIERTTPNFPNKIPRIFSIGLYFLSTSYSNQLTVFERWVRVQVNCRLPISSINLYTSYRYQWRGQWEWWLKLSQGAFIPFSQ